MKKMDIQNLPFAIAALLLIGICSCDPEDVDQSFDEDFDAIDGPNPSEQPGADEIDANEPETVEVINDPRLSDFNGDGFADLAIGVPNDDASGVTSGSVNVLYGSEYGLTADGNQIWHHGNIDTGGAATPNAGDEFGYALAAGDFNNDGYADLAIGAPGDNVFVGTALQDDAGTVTVLYGSEDGLAEDGQLWHQGGPTAVDPLMGQAEAGDRFGFALTTGDFGIDAGDDLAIGVPYEDIGTDPSGVDAGAVNVIYGSTAAIGLTSTGNDRLYQGVEGGLAGTPESADRLGWALAAGDFDSDEDDDLAIGVPAEDLPDGVGAVKDVGLVHVVDGSATGLTTPAPEVWNQGTSGILDNPEAEDQFGFALAAGDFDNDGADDLAIGVPFENVNFSVNAGAVNVIYGANGGLTVIDDQFWHQDIANLEGSADEDDRFGQALVAGNFNGDTRDDLAVGSPGEDLGSDDIDAGAVNVIYGRSSSGLGVSGDQRWNQDTSGILETAAAGDSFGFALSAGNFDNDDDGTTDLAIGVPFENVGSIADAGSVNVLYGNSIGLDDIGNQLWHQAVADILGIAKAGDRFGFAVE